MKKLRVLLLEDRYELRSITANLLEDSGMDVIACENPGDASYAWENQDAEGRIDAVVFDLMMGVKGLKPDETESTHSGMFTGWVWLWKSINRAGQNPHPTADRILIAYSGYWNFFIPYLGEKDENDPERLFFEKYVYFVQKGSVKNENEMLEILKKRKPKSG